MRKATTPSLFNKNTTLQLCMFIVCLEQVIFLDDDDDDDDDDTFIKVSRL